MAIFQKRYYKVFKVQNVDLYYSKIVQNKFILFRSFNNSAYEQSNENLLSIHERVLVHMILTSAVFNKERQSLATNITDHNLVEVKALNQSIGAQFF